MLGQATFGWMDKHCKQATGYNGKVFGGKSLILTGDPGQLPPVADKPLYHAKPSNAVGEQGFQAYHMFNKVVKLTVNQRVQGMTPEQVQFTGLLLRLRKGESTVDEWELLQTRQPSNVTNLYEFEDSTRLFYSNEQVGNYNHEQLTKLGLPIAHINALHSSAVAKKISSDDMSGLEPVVFLAKGARERTAGVSYVAISPVKSLASRLSSLKSSDNLQYGLEEENRLDQLAQATTSAFRTENY